MNTIFNSEINYTNDELLNIKRNLKKATGDDFIEFKLDMCNISKYIKNYEIKVGDEFTFFNYYNISKFGDRSIGWLRIKVTYIRDGVIFFKFHKGRKEYHMETDSPLYDRLIPIRIEFNRLNIPIKNLQLIKFNKGNYPNDIVIYNIGNNKKKLVI